MDIEKKISKLDLKRIIKLATLLIGFALITFISFFNAKFDLSNFNFEQWLANSSILVGIMIFGILMGNSVGSDKQKEKVDGLYQNSCNDYIAISDEIDTLGIRIYFSQFWLWFKERKLIEKKINNLINNNFDGRIAKIIVKNIEKEDLEVGKYIIDENNPTEKIYFKNDIPLKKITIEQGEIVKKTLDFTLDTFGDSYYLSMYDDDIDSNVNEAEKGKKIAQKIARDKRNNYALKISSSLIISIVWSALTINEFLDGSDEARRQAWLNLLSRFTALITSFVSGYSTSIINVRDSARAIENKTHILKELKVSYEKKIFIPETYEQMIQREIKEQQENNSIELVKQIEYNDNAINQ